MTNFTSFVAVEDRVVNRNGKPVTVEVPAQVPAGVDPEMVTWGDPNSRYSAVNEGDVAYTTNAQQSITVSGSGGGGGGGVRSRNASYARLANPSLVLPPPSTKGPGKKRRSGRSVGYGNGVGYGSGNGSGAGSAPPPATSAGVLNGASTSLPKPEYPAAARAVHADGVVSVQIIVDTSGNVISASAVSGHPLLQAAAVQAAKQAKFTPTLINGVPIFVRGVIDYNFEDPMKTAAVTMRSRSTETPYTGSVTPAPPSPEMVHDQLLKQKLHTWLYALVNRITYKVDSPATNESQFVRDGKANIQIDLTRADAATIEKIKAAGLEVVGQKGNRVTGRVALDKLAGLADIAEVKLILPLIG
jgi:TonB family protein